MKITNLVSAVSIVALFISLLVIALTYGCFAPLSRQATYFLVFCRKLGAQCNYRGVDYVKLSIDEVDSTRLTSFDDVRSALESKHRYRITTLFINQLSAEDINRLRKLHNISNVVVSPEKGGGGQLMEEI